MITSDTNSCEPIFEDSAFVRKVLEELEPSSLMMAIVHLTGDTSVLHGHIKRRHVTVVEQATPDADGDYLISGFTRAEVDWIRARAAEAIEAYRARGCTLPPLPDTALNEMLAYTTGRTIDAAFAEFMTEELMLDDRDLRAVTIDDPQAKERALDFPVLIIGAGLGGLLAAIRLKTAGIPFRIVEKNKGVGGTWFENKYPGCRVDVAGHSYSYSFEPNFEWSQHFPTSPEIHAYFERCAVKFGLLEHVDFETGVVEARFDNHRKDWVVRLAHASGRHSTGRFRAIVSAVGQLNKPKLPDVPGLESFAGTVVHSAQWPKDFSIDGRRVAVLGSGASALQIVPEVAKTASYMVAFARSAAWMFPNPTYHEHVTEAQRWALKKIPFFHKWYRFSLFYAYTEGAFAETISDPAWTSPLSISKANDDLREMMTGWISSQVDDPELLNKVLPSYPPFGKRILQDNGSYLKALQRDNVDLETLPITRIVPQGVEVDNGRTYDVDTIICATGFEATKFLFPINIVGQGGRVLADEWQQDNARAYLGITVPNFPNLFCIYGPNTNLAQAGSIVFNTEAQVRYIMESIKLLLEGGFAAMDCRQDVHDVYNDEVDTANAATAWGVPGVKNWFKNSKGRVTANLPFRTIDYWARTRRPAPADYIFLAEEADETAPAASEQGIDA